MKDAYTAVSVCALLLVSTVVACSSGATLRFADEKQYLILATNLIEKGAYTFDGVRPTAYRPPGYVWLLAPFVGFGAGVTTLKLLNAGLLALTALVAGRFLSAHGLRFGIVAAASLVLAYPVLLYVAGTLFPQTLAGLLLVITISLLFSRERTRLRTATAGLVYGYLILTVPTFLALAAAVATALWLVHAPRERAMHVTVFVVLAAVVVGAWTARNYVAFGKAILIATNGGENLLLGNSEHTTPRTGVMADISAQAAIAVTLDEVAKDSFYRHEALLWIANHPARAGRLFLEKLVHHFHYRNDLAQRTEQSTAKDLVLLVTYYPLLFATLALVLRRHPRPGDWEYACIGLYGAFALISAVFFTRIRYRVPADVLLIVVCARALAEQIEWRARSMGRDTAGVAA
jgi:hypothetical protein